MPQPGRESIHPDGSLQFWKGLCKLQVHNLDFAVTKIDAESRGVWIPAVDSTEAEGGSARENAHSQYAGIAGQ